MTNEQIALDFAYDLWDAFNDFDKIHNDLMDTHTPEQIKQAQDEQLKVLRDKADAFYSALMRVRQPERTALENTLSEHGL